MTLSASISEAKRAVQTRTSGMVTVSASALLDLVGEARRAARMRTALIHAITTSHRISAGADVCDEWALELEAMRQAAVIPSEPAEK